MPEPERTGRPLSPHLTIYRPQINSMTSILHRITGVCMLPGAIIIVWWVLAAATGETYFAFVDGIITSWPGLVVLVGSLWALWYHFCTGVRHLVWDTGIGYGITAINLSGWIVIGASIALTALSLVLI